MIFSKEGIRFANHSHMENKTLNNLSPEGKALIIKLEKRISKLHKELDELELMYNLRNDDTKDYAKEITRLKK